MVYDGVLEGRYVDLKSCSIEDAEFTLSIRQDPSYSSAIPLIEGTVEQQIAWIKKQRESSDDFFFVVWDKNGNRIGTIGLYDIKGNTCESGRIIIKGNPFQCIEAQVLLDDFGYDHLGLSQIISYIFADNDRALRFSNQFGGTFDELPVYKNDRPMLKKTNSKNSYEEARKKLAKMLYR